jgi:hypothetical protein
MSPAAIDAPADTPSIFFACIDGVPVTSDDVHIGVHPGRASVHGYNVDFGRLSDSDFLNAVDVAQVDLLPELIRCLMILRLGA